MKTFRSHKVVMTVLLAGVTALIGLRAAQLPGTYFEVTKHLEILTSVFKGVHEFYVEEPEPGTLMSVAIDAMLDELDPYTVYYPESRIEDLRFMNTGEYGGIGALVQPINGKTTIIEVYEGYPAQEAGLQSGASLWTETPTPRRLAICSKVSLAAKSRFALTAHMQVASWM